MKLDIQTLKTPLNKSSKHGLEREALRIDSEGNISRKKHPLLLGSALKNPCIKTDFSEAQIEYVTKPYPSIEETLSVLDDLHHFTGKRLEEETLWPFSMPSILPEDENDIPLAYYGTTQEAQKKTVYRRGLGYRYGRKMQTISGVHYNFSFSDELLEEASQKRYGQVLSKESRSELYFGLIRNFNRLSPLLIYLFGASPVVDHSFVNEPQLLQELFPNTFGFPYATSLRLSRIGYTSENQDSLHISMNSLPEYIRDLRSAIQTVYPPFLKYSMTPGNQLNPNYLQLENEFYAILRPKQTPGEGETPLEALEKRGIDYIEVRCLDIDPFVTNGVSKDSLLFTHMFLIYNLLEAAPELSVFEKNQLIDNQRKVAENGRKPGIKISYYNKEYSVTELGLFIADELSSIAKILDKERGGTEYSLCLQRQKEKFLNPALCPSAKLLQVLEYSKQSFISYGLELSSKNYSYFLSKSLSSCTEKSLECIANKSLFEQRVEESKESSEYVEIPIYVCNV
ncbi:MAG: glutamate--cysteine ligase [Leptospiraceae bacterium]|nr:glutamate--cysteine ligase [Leptospiraceae bacterium]MCP5499181.1 glutamate--cysteine ligase [Leptospiraceae bacterium]